MCRLMNQGIEEFRLVIMFADMVDQVFVDEFTFEEDQVLEGECSR